MAVSVTNTLNNASITDLLAGIFIFCSHQLFELSYDSTGLHFRQIVAKLAPCRSSSAHRLDVRPEILCRIELGPAAAGGHGGVTSFAGEEAAGARRDTQRCVLDHDAAAAQHRHRPPRD